MYPSTRGQGQAVRAHSCRQLLTVCLCACSRMTVCYVEECVYL